MNLETTLQTLADLNIKLKATNEQIFKLNFELQNKVLSRKEKSSLYGQIFNLDKTIEEIEEKAVKTARILIVVSNKNNQLA
ncbi:MAG: hypothetical protein RLZZ605_666 [Bacteroidota bacterium]|jgi:hypothetical protein